MKRYSRIFYTFLAYFLGMLLPVLSSCSEWDDHYGMDDKSVASQNLMELLANNPETSSFASIVRQSGYDKLLEGSQSYTVFAPTNKALANYKETRIDSLRRLVNNHIARYTQPTSTSTSIGVKMLNGKVYYFNSPTGFSGVPFGAVTNDKATNGILHEMSDRLPYFSNIYELLANSPDYSKVYDFIHQFDEVKFDRENSTEIDVDDQGRPVYDSVWINYNKLLDHVAYGIGRIQKEDSAYAMIVPNNTAWDEAYNRIKPSFAFYSTDEAYADSVQDIRTKLAIINDLVYRTSSATPWSADSLQSTSGSVIKNISQLFNGTVAKTVSNGHVFVTSNLGYNNRETWDKPILVEAEEQNGRTYNNSLTSVYTRNMVATSPIQNISGDAYIQVQPISSSSNPTLTFDIPDVLAGKYDIYAVFLPASANGVDMEADSTRIGFSLQYMNERGGKSTKRNRSTSDVSLITKSRELTVMRAFGDFEFPMSNTIDRLWLMDDNNDVSPIETTTKLTVQTNVTTREYSAGTYSRTFRLDRILFVPVEK